jgi:very-short-patch-repair endonuclease
MHNQTNPVILSEYRPRELRNNSTDAEQRLWYQLRNRQVLGAKFRRQHALDNYIVDFVSFDAMLIIELDGGQHSEQTAYDEKRDETLARIGFKVLRIWNNEVFGNLSGVMDTIYFTVEGRFKQLVNENHPHPSPPLEGEGATLAAPVHGPGTSTDNHR